MPAYRIFLLAETWVDKSQLRCKALKKTICEFNGLRIVTPSPDAFSGTDIKRFY